MNSTKLEPHHLNLPTRRYIFLKMYTNLWKRINKQKWKPNPTAGPARRTRRPAKHALARPRTRRGPRWLPPARFRWQGDPARQRDRQGRKERRRRNSSPVTASVRPSVLWCSPHQCAS